MAHLPQHIQDELQSISGTIVQLVNPEMLILFGSYSRNNWVEGHRYIENGITYEYKSDYDILVVTKTAQEMPPKLGKEIRRRIKKAENLQTTPHIIFHDIKFLNNELSDGHYFFVDIVKEGIMLYNTGNYELATPRILNATERAKQAQVYFDEWFKSAGEFLIDSQNAFDRGSYNNSIFHLHQATERYFMTVLLVFTHYKPKTHDLNDLNKQAGYADARFKSIFPNHTDEEKRLFELLVKSYIDSRYKLGYTINPADLQWLGQRVQLLKEMVEEVCREKIKEFVE